MRAINSSVMKMMNRKMLLESIRRKPISRAELAEETRLTRASITQIVDGLMEEGLVTETNTVSRSTPGRKQTQLALVEDALCIAGVYCGRKGYSMGIINLKGEVLWSAAGEYSDKDISAIMDEVAEKLKEAVDSRNLQAKVYGLGACLPSPVKREYAEEIRKPGAWKRRNEEFAEEMKKRLGWDVYTGSASNAHALDELYFGIGMQGAENFMVLRVDESVGAGFIINNKLFMGARGLSPEIGHITLDRNGPACICGNRGCLELFLATPHVLKNTPFSSWKNIMDDRDTNPAAKEIFEAEVETLAFEIMNLANVMDLDKVVVTGDLVYQGDILCEKIWEFMDEHFIHRLAASSVMPAAGVNLARISCMPAYHSIFA